MYPVSHDELSAELDTMLDLIRDEIAVHNEESRDKVVFDLRLFSVYANLRKEGWRHIMAFRIVLALLYKQELYEEALVFKGLMRGARLAYEAVERQAGVLEEVDSAVHELELEPAS